MNIFKKLKDGGPDSNVTGYFLIEIKSLFSIVLLKFEDGSRVNYHSHAFNALSWLLSGQLIEYHTSGNINSIQPSWKSFITTKECFHRVRSHGTSWALTFRGPWDKTWKEYSPQTNEEIVLSNGRKEESRKTYSK